MGKQYKYIHTIGSYSVCKYDVLNLGHTDKDRVVNDIFIINQKALAIYKGIERTK